MWTDSWFDGMMCSNYFSCTYWSWLSVYTVDYLCWFHCAWDSNVPIGRKVKTGFLASGTEMPVESFPVRPSQIIFWQRAIWHCVRYVTQYQHMPCMLYFNLALPLGNAVPSISCWLSCICTPKRMLYHAEYLGMMMKSERWCISGWRHSQATPPAPDETMK